MNNKRKINRVFMNTVAAGVLAGAGVVAGPAGVARAEECPSPGSGGQNIPLHVPQGGGGGGAAVGEASAAMTHEAQNSGAYVAAQVCAVQNSNPGKNVMIIQHETYDGPVNLTGVTKDYDISIANNGFDVFVFDSGSFTNGGDMGYENWAWSGTNWTRSEDKRTVTFNAP